MNNNRQQFNRNFIPLLLFFITFNLQGFVNCGLCETCICTDYNKDSSDQIVDCRNKRLEGSSVLKFDLLMFDEQPKLSLLDLAENELELLPLDIFRNLKDLRSLNLSHNLLRHIPSNVFNHLESLTVLDLSQNNITDLSESIFNQITKLESLNLSDNKFSELDPGLRFLTKLTSLDISRNNLNALTNTSLNALTELRYLDLSFNRINSLGEDNLIHLKKLETLYLNNNRLVYLSSHELPVSIRSLYAGYNAITTVPDNLIELRILEIEYNEISELNATSFTFARIESLNFSGNKLTDFPKVKLEILDTLDLSFNQISTVPESLSREYFPQLSALVISGNPVRDLTFKSELNLELLIARSMNLLENIEAGAFEKLVNLRPNGCLNLTISLNERLEVVDERAFAELNLCSLDLSGNNLNSVSRALIKSRNKLGENYVINLQGNPFHCDCSLQWILVDLIPELYSRHPELLEDLRCSSPLEFKDMRMVHWYQWKEQVFCKDLQTLIAKTEVQAAGVLSGSSGTIKIESSTGMLAALIGAVVVLSMMVIIGIVWARRITVRRSRRNRRF